MAKYKTLRIYPSANLKINRKLATKQPQVDRLDNVLSEFDELEFMKQNEFYTPKDIQKQKQFLQKLLLEAELIEINGEPKIRKPILQKSRIESKIETLETEVKFWEHAIAEQRNHLEIHKKNKDQKNYTLVKSAIEELKKHYENAKLKLERYTQILKLLNKN